jgi:hypothetical protein
MVRLLAGGLYSSASIDDLAVVPPQSKVKE